MYHFARHRGRPKWELSSVQKEKKYIYILVTHARMTYAPHVPVNLSPPPRCSSAQLVSKLESQVAQHLCVRKESVPRSIYVSKKRLMITKIVSNKEIGIKKKEKYLFNVEFFPRRRNRQLHYFFAGNIKRTQQFIFGGAEIKKMTQIMANALLV